MKMKNSENNKERKIVMENNKNIKNGETTPKNFKPTPTKYNIKFECPIMDINEVEQNIGFKLPFFVQDYLFTLTEQKEVTVGEINNVEDIENTDTDVDVWFYRLSYTTDDFDYDPWETGEVSLESLIRDKKETVDKLNANGFINMNHIFQYQQSIIFMKCNPVELTRFIIKRYLDSCIGYYDNNDANLSNIEIKSMLYSSVYMTMDNVNISQKIKVCPYHNDINRTKF